MTFASLFASMFFSGRSFSDYESSRETARLQLAGKMAAAAGAVREYTHDDNLDGFDWATRRPLHKCAGGCSVSYPAWVTAEWLADVYAQADRAVVARAAAFRSMAKPVERVLR